MEHELKIETKFLEQIFKKNKTFEIRKNNRNYEVDDILILKEWDDKKKRFSSNWLEARVTYISDYQQKPGYVVLAIKVEQWIMSC